MYLLTPSFIGFRTSIVICLTWSENSLMNKEDKEINGEKKEGREKERRGKKEKKKM